MKKLIFIIMTSFVFMTLSSALADVPRVLNYQGYVEDSGGVPIDGPGYFKFAIVNQAGDTSYWSNDATSTTGDEPTDYVVIAVSDGFFSLKLGDTDITNMGVLDTTPFEQQNIYVRVWFSDTGTVFQLLTPDTQIASAGFAYKAQTVEEVPPGTVDWLDLTGIPADIADGDDVGVPVVETDPTVLPSVKDGVSWAEVTAKPAGFADNVDNDSGGDITAVYSGVGTQGGSSSGTATIQFDCSEVMGSGIRCDGEAINAYSLSASDGYPDNAVYVNPSGNVGIGTTNPGQRLEVNGNLSVTGSVMATGTGLSLSCIHRTHSYSQAPGTSTNIYINSGAGTNTTTVTYCGAGYQVFHSSCVSGGGGSTIYLNQSGIYYGDALCTYYNSGATARTVYVEADCCRGSW